MNSRIIERRSLLAGASAMAALLPLQRALAQTTAETEDWLEMVKAQHTLIATALQEAIGAASSSNGELTAALQKLGFLLTAHSVAEENVLYPALAAHGIPIGSAELYLEQDAQKVLNAQINTELHEGTEEHVLAQLKSLQAIILEHAKSHEEGDLYPKLHSRLSASQNAYLSQMYARFFAMVKPT